MTPRHRESDTKGHRRSITKQGSRLLRCAAAEAISKNHAGGEIKDAHKRIAARRARNIARVAAAAPRPRLLRPRDGEIRCLARARQG